MAALVLNYNGREVTLETLASLEALDYPNADLVVVDNGSTDGSEAAIAVAHPGVEQVRVVKNRGIAHGLNVGLRWALDRGYDYLLVMNNDIEVAPDLLSRLVEVAESDTRAAIVGPKAYYYWDRQRIWSAGGVIRFRESVTRERGMGEVDRGQFDAAGEVDYVNGCAALMRASVVREVGLFDPMYFISVEDADWCMRARKLGHVCHYTPEARLWHRVSHTTGGYTAGRTYHTGRSTAIFVRRYARLSQWATFLAFATLALPVALAREALRGNASAAIAKWRGMLAGLRVGLEPPPRWEPS